MSAVRCLGLRRPPTRTSARSGCPERSDGRTSARGCRWRRSRGCSRGPPRVCENRPRWGGWPRRSPAGRRTWSKSTSERARRTGRPSVCTCCRTFPGGPRHVSDAARAAGTSDAYCFICRFQQRCGSRCRTGRAKNDVVSWSPWRREGQVLWYLVSGRCTAVWEYPERRRSVESLSLNLMSKNTFRRRHVACLWKTVIVGNNVAISIYIVCYTVSLWHFMSSLWHVKIKKPSRKSVRQKTLPKSRYPLNV